MANGSALVASAPPIGLSVTALPAGYSTTWIDGNPYFVSGGAYYVWREREKRYEIVVPPVLARESAPGPGEAPEASSGEPDGTLR